MNWDIFISHASEDKDTVARPLAEALAVAGLNVWIDEAEVCLGDSLREKIDEGLAASRFGVVVLSEDFFNKRWPRFELDGLVSREHLGEKIILPIWVNLTVEKVASYSPLLASRFAVRMEDGLESCVKAIVGVVRSERLPRKSPNSEVEEGEGALSDSNRLYFISTLQDALRVYTEDWAEGARRIAKRTIEQIGLSKDKIEEFLLGERVKFLFYFPFFAMTAKLESQFLERLRVATVISFQPGLAPDREDDLKKLIEPRYPDIRMPDDSSHWLKRSLPAAATGAAAGSVIPGAGTLAGAFYGFLVGALVGGKVADKDRFGRVSGLIEDEVESSIRNLKGKEALAIEYLVANATSVRRTHR